uniref:Neuronal pentraxin receptor a n=1 Tax=Tetraodon nigroviridis TaxID=99883 RepID=H3D1R1_TETNG
PAATLKFIVVILAAGMVAFIGAVICIIAAVHTGSSRSAAAQRQPAADNHSLYPDSAAQTPAAAVGSLGALHGSEAPTYNIGLGGLDGVTGLSGHDPTVSRLICTPIPAGECNPKNFQQQAEDPSLYSGEDWGHLRNTAEELRQTVLQQKDQIQTDQRTIRELTGKLSECEKGQDGWSSADDSPDLSSDGVHLLTIRAVDELEQAITQLKDRIERLETEVGGKSGDPEGLVAGAIPDRTWNVEDVEGELERKLELLDKNRKALKLETEKHRQEIDHGVDKLPPSDRGTGGSLSAGMLGPSFPEGFRLSFPTRTNYMYAVVERPVPELRAFTFCMWLRPTEGGIGTPLSYAVPAQPNELVLLQGLHTPTELLVDDKVAQLPLNLSRGSWQHICVSWSQKGGIWQAFQGGKLRGEGHSLAAGHHIRPGGVLVLGQEQDSLGGGFDSSQALVGELSQVGLWDRVLPPSQVASLARCGRVHQGSVVSWTESKVEIHGGAAKEAGEPCTKHNRS